MVQIQVRSESSHCHSAFQVSLRYYLKYCRPLTLSVQIVFLAVPVNLSPLFLCLYGRINIEIRGSSSQVLPKKQFGLTTLKADNTSNNNVSLLGMQIGR